jgi:putative exosortase-associated protein (TIGR04073 family)
MARSRKMMVASAVLLTVLFSQVSLADQSVMGDPEHGTKCASTKLWRGVVNTCTGLGELIRQPIVCTMDDGLVGVPVGLINGVFMSLVRTGAGIIEIVTFPMPLDEELGYDSLMNPDYVWQKTK